jgi:hypothetical protein
MRLCDFALGGGENDQALLTDADDRYCLSFPRQSARYDDLIDHLMNLHYREMKAYTCFPPLCLTDNDSETEPE